MNTNDKTYHLIGGANIDISGKSFEALRRYDSNPAEISICFGGVARNIAHTLRRLGCKVRFQTAFGDDLFGKACSEDCEKLGIDISDSVIAKKRQSSMYLAILSNNGEMNCAVSDMRVLDTLTFEDILKFISRIEEKDILLLDTNLSVEKIDFIMGNCNCLVVSDPISTLKAVKLSPYLSRLRVLKPNRLEAQVLSGIEIKDEETLFKSGEFFRRQGVKDTIITLGEKGGLLCCEKGFFRFSHKSITPVNATGAGDAFMATYLAFIDEDPISRLKFAVASSIATCFSEKTVLDDICLDYLLEIQKDYPIQVEEIRC